LDTPHSLREALFDPLHVIPQMTTPPLIAIVEPEGPCDQDHKGETATPQGRSTSSMPPESYNAEFSITGHNAETNWTARCW
jgi:hypothetical protein